MAASAVAQKGVSVALACRTFCVSETCYRYQPKLDAENWRIAGLLLGLAQTRRTWGFGLCFLYLRNVKGHGAARQSRCEGSVNQDENAPGLV